MVSSSNFRNRRGNLRGLSEFQYSILYSVTNQPMYGLGIKQQLQDYYDDEVNHGRLYPNLDNLVERDFLHKRSLDDRTNEYAITERGLAAILDRTEWEIEQLVEDQEAIEQLIELLESAVNDH